MKRFALISIMLGALAAFAGCGYHPIVTVYGKSGAVFTAPSLCAALVACEKSTEISCRYDVTVLQTAIGQTEVEQCKEVKK